jgi:hypothetical protein
MEITGLFGTPYTPSSGLSIFFIMPIFIIEKNKGNKRITTSEINIIPRTNISGANWCI